MSSHPNPSSVLSRPRLSVPEIAALKGVRPIVALTAYTAPMARLLDAETDILLVGDSLGMVIYGMESTLPVSLDDMIRHGRAVVNASQKALVVVDLPFGSYQASPSSAFEAASRVLKETGAAAVKLEGGMEMTETISFLVRRGVPVMAHVGLMPQHVHAMGGYRWQGRDRAEREAILEDATAVEQAGAFAVLLEGIDGQLAANITGRLSVPTIGIGAGVACDGQILVCDDLLGLTEKTPKFVRRYAEIGTTVTEAIRQYAEDVRQHRFPVEGESYGVSVSEAETAPASGNRLPTKSA